MNCMLDCSGIRNTHDFVILSRIREQMLNLYIEHNTLHMEHKLNIIGKILELAPKHNGQF